MSTVYLNIKSFALIRNLLTLTTTKPMPEPKNRTGQCVNRKYCEKHLGWTERNQHENERYQQDVPEWHALAQIEILEADE